MSNKKVVVKVKVKYQKVNEPEIPPDHYDDTTDAEIDIENEEKPHPLESSNCLVKVCHYLFHIWVFKLISICYNAETLQANDLPQLPKKMTITHNYQQWMKIYNNRKNKNLSTKTLSMIFHTEKYTIMLIIILNGMSIFVVNYTTFIIVKEYLYTPMLNILLGAKDNKINLLWDLSKYGFIIFAAAEISSILRALASLLQGKVVVRIVGCLQYILFKKLLSIDINESNKQQLLNTVGAELGTLNRQLVLLVTTVPTCIFCTILLQILLYDIVGYSSFFGIVFAIFICLPFTVFGGVKYAQNQRKRLIVSAKRVQLITQLISGIRFLKTNASEIALMKKITEYRLNELSYVKNINVAMGIMFLVNIITPPLMIFVILMVYQFVFNNNVKALTIIHLVMTIFMAQTLCRAVPSCISCIGLIVLTTKKIDDFLNKTSKPKESMILQSKESSNTVLQINNAFFKRSLDNNFMLKGICLNLKKGKLIGIIGSVGSGKTSLIQAILGEIKCIKGNINYNLNVNNGFGYCSQTSYIQNATFRSNIIMDLEFIEEKYKKCIFCADLYSDLKQLPQGDLTLIGTQGVNISGGQAMRLCFARCLYRKDKYDLFLFDDPLSSVDIFVGKHMFHNGILKYLQLKENNKTCLMTINSHLYLLKYFDEIIVMENGEIKLHSETNNLLGNPQNNNLYQKYSYLLPEITDAVDEEIKESDDELDIKDMEITDNENMEINNLYFNEQNLLKVPGFNVYKEIIKYSLINVDCEKQFYQDSETDIIVPKRRLILRILIALILFGFSSALILCDVWLVIWRENMDKIPISQTLTNVNLTDIGQEFGNEALEYPNSVNEIKQILNNHKETVNQQRDNAYKQLQQSQNEYESKNESLLSNVNEINNKMNNYNKLNLQWIEIDNKSTLWYWIVWFLLLILIVFMTFILFYYIGNVILSKASQSIFNKTLLNIFKCNTLFFDIIPRGQLLNVLSSDPNEMDGDLPVYLFGTILLWGSLISYFIMIVIITPSILLLYLFFVFPITYIIWRRLKKTYYSFSTLWKLSLSPILSLFDESIIGLDSIRGYKIEKYFLKIIGQRIDTACKFRFYEQSVDAWSQLYFIGFLNFCLLLTIPYIGVRLLYFHHEHDLNLLTLSIWWCNANIQMIFFGLQATNGTDRYVSSIQKMFFYCNSDKNIDMIYKSQKQKNNEFYNNDWPIIGNINIQKLKLQYRKNFDIVLNINKEININHGMKLAICGRTASGKSSILVSIFRLFEPYVNSNVEIDKINIYSLGLFDVRSNISIIMQEPIIFSGTFRFNLDPFNKYTDEEIWNVLKDVQLFDLINNRENKLFCNVGENGSMFSVGEKQLICFGRAMLKKSPILFMDEPTSSIDKNTDKIIQRLIRSKKFENTTVICIAHRLQSILDYDYILLLENGKILEYDKPNNLVNNKGSTFYNLLKTSNLYHK